MFCFARSQRRRARDRQSASPWGGGNDHARRQTMDGPTERPGPGAGAGGDGKRHAHKEPREADVPGGRRHRSRRPWCGELTWPLINLWWQDAFGQRRRGEWRPSRRCSSFARGVLHGKSPGAMGATRAHGGCFEASCVASVLLQPSQTHPHHLQIARPRPSLGGCRPAAQQCPPSRKSGHAPGSRPARRCDWGGARPWRPCRVGGGRRRLRGIGRRSSPGSSAGASWNASTSVSPRPPHRGPRKATGDWRPPPTDHEHGGRRAVEQSRGR